MFVRMQARINYLIRVFTLEVKHEASRFRTNNWTRKSLIPIVSFGCIGFGSSPIALATKDKNTSQSSKLEKHIKESLAESAPSIWAKIWKALIHIIRFFHLLLIFTPPILLLPLLFFKRTENYWRDVFVKAVERAGVVFIKAFQYLSHRRDIIGPEMAHKFEYLR